MNRQELEKHIFHTYGVSLDFPWMKYPSFAVFRHESNQKWFAVIMTIDRRKLGIEEDGQIDVVNVKCEPNFVASTCGQQGIYPAYHMNKEKWISILLDNSVPMPDIAPLIDISYVLTDKKKKPL